MQVPCFGVHSDDVGLRYLIQQNKVGNALGVKRNPKFKVKGPKYKYECPHNHIIQDFGCSNDDPLIKYLSPIPSDTKGYVFEGDASELATLAKFSGADCLSGWMLNRYIRERIALASNIQLTIVMGCKPHHAEDIDEMQDAMDYAYGKVIFQGDYYFSDKFERIGMPPKVEDPFKVGASNLFKFLKERD